MSKTKIQTSCFICGFTPGRLLESNGEVVCRKCAQGAIDRMVEEKRGKKA